MIAYEMEFIVAEPYLTRNSPMVLNMKLIQQ